MNQLYVCVLLLIMAGGMRPAAGQAVEGAMTDAEVESLRAAAYVPIDRLRAYEIILDARARKIDDLVSKRRRPGYAQDLHDAIEQFAGVIDELNDNLDEYQILHRDIRTALPHLTACADRWTKTLQAPPEDDEYNAVRKIALRNTADTRALSQETLDSLDAYFKEHPEAALAEKKRRESPHAPSADGPR